MAKIKTANKAYPLLTMLIGLFSFLISGMITGLISLTTNEGLILLLGAPIGSLLMLFFLHKLNKSNILSVIIRSEFGVFIGFLTGFILGELLAWIIGLFVPSLKNLEQVNAQIIPNIALLIAADAIYGALLGNLLYGRKSMKFFALICGIASIPFGVLLSMPINMGLSRFNQNLLFTLVSFGTTTGLSIGIHAG